MGKNNIRTALILEGGALRGFFTMAVLDFFMEKRLSFNYINGVSVGALCAADFLSNQIKRTAKINLHFLHNKNYMGFRNFIRCGEIFNLDFLFSKNCLEYSPFNFSRFYKNSTIFEITSTNLKSGRSTFFKKNNNKFWFSVIKASSSTPLLSRVKIINSVPYLDGSISSSIPFKRAMDLGYEKIILILTRDKNYRMPKNNLIITKLVKKVYKKYPNFIKTFLKHPINYNQDLKEINKLEKQRKLFVIRPKKPVKVSRTEQNKNKLINLYNEGLEVAKDKFLPLKAYLNN